MGKDELRKLKQYIKDDRPSRFKSYTRKQDVVLKEIILNRGRTLLHYCCKHGSTQIFRYLLGEGVDSSIPDLHGNTVLHVALKRALSSSDDTNLLYTEMILPLIQKSPHLLEMKNNDGVTCRKLLDQLVLQRQKSQSAQNTYSHDSRAESSWEAKLADELTHEYAEEYGRYNPQCDFEEETSAETYDDWAERIRQEYHKSRRFHAMPQNVSQKKVQDSDETSTLPNLEKIREEMKRKYESNQRAAKESFERHKKKRYEEKCRTIFNDNSTDVLNYDDIPWPCIKDTTELSTMLFCDISDKISYRKYLREQQVRWHPDKFHQKLGNRLAEKERDKIMNKVKQISQELNILSDVSS